VARIFITGSADGLGLEQARELDAGGHQVVLHGRNQRRADDARRAVPGAAAVLVGDLSSIAQTHALARQAGDHLPFDVIVHNAAVGYREHRQLTEDGFEHVFAVNVLAPYLLTALLPAPARLIYLTSGLHRGGEVRLDDLTWERRPWSGMQAYSDSKLLDAVLAFAVARCWPDVYSNAVEPGWVATRMGGAGAPGTLAEGVATQLWLATGDEPAANVSGRLFYQCRDQEAHPGASDRGTQDELLHVCEQVSGVALPEAASAH
jgi:NAD(P)-dependent dehydrogenase (short-subunit alcohol dehydrogenase family)